MKIEDLRLMKNNPRFVNRDDSILLDVLKSKDSNYDEKEIIEKLISVEGDFSELLELMQSIQEDGFNSDLDNMILLKTEEGKFVSLEGNRRTMVLRSLWLEKTREIFKDALIDSKTNSQLNSGLEQEQIIEKVKNIDKIIFICGESKNLEDDINAREFSASDLKDPMKIWKSIYSRHTASSRGKKSWERSHVIYMEFEELKNFFNLSDPSKDLKDRFTESIKKTSSITQRDVADIRNDIKSAVWLKWVERYSKINDTNTPNFNTLKLISALEISGSTIKYEDDNGGNVSLHRMMGYSMKKEFNPNLPVDTWVEINGDLKHINEDDTIAKSILANNLYKWFYTHKPKLYNTRGWRFDKEEVDEFVGELGSLFNSSTPRQSISTKAKKISKISESKRTPEEILIFKSEETAKKLLKEMRKFKKVNKEDTVDVNDRYKKLIDYISRYEFEEAVKKFRKSDDTEVPVFTFVGIGRVMLDAVIYYLMMQSRTIYNEIPASNSDWGPNESDLKIANKILVDLDAKFELIDSKFNGYYAAEFKKYYFNKKGKDFTFKNDLDIKIKSEVSIKEPQKIIDFLKFTNNNEMNQLIHNPHISIYNEHSFPLLELVEKVMNMFFELIGVFK